MTLYAAETSLLIEMAVAEWTRHTCLIFEKHDFFVTIPEQHIVFDKGDGLVNI